MGDAGVQVVKDSIRTPLRDSYPRFVQAARDRGSIEAAEAYERALEEFLAGCPKTYADELTREDVTRFHVQMKGRGLSERTVSNRHFNLRAFLLSLGLDVKMIAGKPPRYDEKLPEIYESEELAAFFSSLKSEYDRTLFKLPLASVKGRQGFLDDESEMLRLVRREELMRRWQAANLRSVPELPLRWTSP